MTIMLFDWVMPNFLLLETYHPYPIYSTRTLNASYFVRSKETHNDLAQGDSWPNA